MQSLRLRLAASLLVLVPAIALCRRASGPMVKVQCKPTDEKLVFHCTFEVMGKKSHEPIEGAAFKVNADMSTMPLRPQRESRFDPEPVAGNARDGTRGSLELEMLGEWAIKMTFDEPVRDIVIREGDVRRRGGGDGSLEDGPFQDEPTCDKTKEQADHSGHSVRTGPGT